MVAMPETAWWLIDFHTSHPLECYRRLTFMMLDANVVATKSIQRPLHAP